jgi:hypothetical protein
MLTNKSPLPVDPTPQKASRVPFASEMDLHRFVEEHAKTTLNLDVVASAQRGGGRLFDIDILAVGKSNRPFIIECKWDKVDSSAIEQLAKYKNELLSGWTRFEKRLREARGGSLEVKKTEPVLVTIGYRYDPALLIRDQPAVCLAYSYHGVKFTDETFQKQKAGRVSLHFATDAGPTARHPTVGKELGTDARLEQRAPGLRRSFWALDKKIKTLGSVAFKYGKLARYRWPNGLSATALIKTGFIHWNVKCPGDESTRELDYGVDMHTSADAAKVFTALRDVCHEK